MRTLGILYLVFSVISGGIGVLTGGGIFSLLAVIAWPVAAFGVVADAVSSCWGPGCLDGYAVARFLGSVMATAGGELGVLFCGLLLVPMRWWWRLISVATYAVLNGLYVSYHANIVAKEMHWIARPLYEHIMFSAAGFSLVAIYAAAITAAFARRANNP